MESVHGTGVWSDSQVLMVTVASAAFWMEGWVHFGSAAVPCLALADASCSEAAAVVSATVAALTAAVVGAAVGAAAFASEATLLMNCAGSRGRVSCCAIVGVRLDFCLSFLACFAAALAAALADTLAFRCTWLCQDVCAGMTPDRHSSAVHVSRITESQCIGQLLEATFETMHMACGCILHAGSTCSSGAQQREF